MDKVVQQGVDLPLLSLVLHAQVISSLEMDGQSNVEHKLGEHMRVRFAWPFSFCSRLTQTPL